MAAERLRCLQTDVQQRQDVLHKLKAEVEKLCSTAAADKTRAAQSRQEVAALETRAEELISGMQAMSTAMQQQCDKLITETADNDAALLKAMEACTDADALSGAREEDAAVEEAMLAAQKAAAAAALAKANSEAGRKAAAAAEAHHRRLVSFVDEAAEARETIHTSRLEAAEAAAEKAAMGETVAAAIVEMHRKKDEEAAEVRAMVAAASAKHTAALARMQELLAAKADVVRLESERAEAWQQLIEAELVGEPKQAALDAELAAAERAAETKTANLSAALGDATKAHDVAVAKRERAVSLVCDSALQRQAEEAAVRAAAARAVAKARTELAVASAAGAELTKRKADADAARARKVKQLAADAAAREAALETLEVEHRSLRGQVAEARCLVRHARLHAAVGAAKRKRRSAGGKPRVSRRQRAPGLEVQYDDESSAEHDEEEEEDEEEDDFTLDESTSSDWADEPPPKRRRGGR